MRRSAGLGAPRWIRRSTGSWSKIRSPATRRGAESAMRRAAARARAKRAPPRTGGLGRARLIRRLSLGVVLVVATVIVAGIGIVVLRVALHIDLAQDHAGEVRPRLQRQLQAGDCGLSSARAGAASQRARGRFRSS